MLFKFQIVVLVRRLRWVKIFKVSKIILEKIFCFFCSKGRKEIDDILKNEFEKLMNSSIPYQKTLHHFLALNVPLGDQSNPKNKMYLSAYNEIFLNAESAVFDRNRLYGGLGYRMNKNLRMELGYMNQFFERSGRDQINLFFLVNFNEPREK